MAAAHDPTRTVSPAGPDATQTVTDPAVATGGALPPLSTDQPPASAGRYVLGEEIARGGMGVVYRSTDTILGREVAIKVLQEKFGPASAAARRFGDEARISGQLQHPAIPPVHDLGSLPDGRPFLAMKLIKGDTLDHLLKDRPDPAHDRGRFVGAFEQICQALAYAHTHKVIHRDLKPANVMVGNFGEVQVMDWGLAKVLTGCEVASALSDATSAPTEVRSLRDSDGSFTQVGTVLGTPAFLPPEQAVGAVGKIDARSDVFGLGAILAVILTGVPPFAGSSAETTRLQAAQGKVEDCFARLDACTAELDLIALCKRCLSPTPAGRPLDGGEVAAAVAKLRSAAEERARTAEREKAAADARAGEQRRKRQWQFAAAGVVGLALVGGILGLGVYLRAQERANADLAAKNAELAAANDSGRQRFNLAVDAIGLFTGDVSQDLLLKEKQFETLRTKLLRGAATFYAKLEDLLRDRTDNQSRAALGRAYDELAALTSQIGDKTEALAVYGKALAVRRALTDQPNSDDTAALNTARSLISAGQLQDELGDTAGALASFAEAHSRLTGSGGQRHKIQGEIARSEYWRGWVLYRSGRLQEALDAYRRAREILVGLVVSHPEIVDYQRHLSWCDNDIGILLWGRGATSEASAAFERARRLKEKVAANHPEVAEYQRDLALALDNNGIILRDTEKPVEALASHEQARVILQRLVDANPAVSLLQVDLSNLHTNIGRLHDREKRYTDALAALDIGLAIRRKLVEGDPKNIWYKENLGESYAYRGGARVRAGQPAEATADLRQAVELLAPSASRNTERGLDYARALALLAGLGKDAKSGVTAAESAAFTNQAVSALADIIKTGWAQPDELRQPDFDPLRGRADFQKQLAEVEARQKADAGQVK